MAKNLPMTNYKIWAREGKKLKLFLRVPCQGMTFFIEMATIKCCGIVE